jgi:hypothetical protein
VQRGKKYGPKTGEAPGEGRKLHNEELRKAYCSLNAVRVTLSKTIWTRERERER